MNLTHHQPGHSRPGGPPPHVHQLNDDILLYIFEDVNSERSISCFLEVLALSQVCNRWRTLAVEHCPSLWTKYALLSSTKSVGGGEVMPGSVSAPFDFTSELLRRCHQLPLEVGWHEWANNDTRNVADFISALQHSSRFQAYSLSFRVVQRGDEEEAAAVLDALARSSPAPNLQSISLNVGHRDAPLEHTMFGGDLSTLSSLQLESPTWIDMEKLNIGQNLRHLRAVSSFLHGRAPQNGLPCTIGLWLKTLKRVPNLRSLNLGFLEYMCHGRIHPPEPNLPHISLDHLTDLSLNFNRFQDLDVFFGHVSMPRCTKLNLEFKTGSGPRYSDMLKKIVTQHVIPPFRNGSVLSILGCIGCSTFTVRFTNVAEGVVGAPNAGLSPSEASPPIDITFCIKPSMTSLDLDARCLDTVIQEYVPFLDHIDFVEVSLKHMGDPHSEDEVIQDFMYHYTHSLHRFIQSSRSPKTIFSPEPLTAKVVPGVVAENGRLYTPAHPAWTLIPRDIEHTCCTTMTPKTG